MIDKCALAQDADVVTMGGDTDRNDSTGPTARRSLQNWDLGGAPSSWTYRHAGALFPALEISVAGSPARLDRQEMPEIGQFPVAPGLTLDEYVAHGERLGGGLAAPDCF